MATISTLAVNLIARTSSFEKGMKRSRNATKSLKATISGAVGSVARFAKGLVLAAGIGGMGFLLKSTLTTLDAVSKLARRLDITHEALLGLRHAGELAGISVQAMDKALETFTRRMGEVKAGSGEAKRGLEALGLSAEKMIAMTPDKALLVIADRIETLGTQAEKAAAAYFLFGRAGAQMLNLFEQGAKGIEEAQKQAKELGITLEGYDLTQIEAANDAMLSFKKSMTSLVQVATIRLSPAITKIVKLITKYREQIVTSTKRTIIFIAKTFLIVKTIKLVGGAIRGLIAIYKSLAAAQTVTLALGGPAGWATLAAGVLIATGAIVGINKAIDGTITGLDKLSSKQQQTLDEAKLVADIAQKQRILAKLSAPRQGFASEELRSRVIAQQKRAIERAKERLVIFRQQADAKDALVKAGIDELSQQKKLKELEIEAVKLTEALLTPAQKLKDEIKLINDLYKEGLITTDQLFKATRKVSLGGLIADADSLKQSLKTPLQLLEDQVKKIGVLFNAALITQEEFTKATNLLSLRDLVAEAKQLKESILTPVELQGREIERINELLAKGLITAEEQQKALAGVGGGGELKGGRFQEIRSEFIDVAALNAGKSTSGVAKTNTLLQESIAIQSKTLNEITGKDVL
jgi:hypothetical protein